MARELIRAKYIVNLANRQQIRDCRAYCFMTEDLEKVSQKESLPWDVAPKWARYAAKLTQDDWFWLENRPIETDKGLVWSGVGRIREVFLLEEKQDGRIEVRPE